MQVKQSESMLVHKVHFFQSKIVLSLKYPFVMKLIIKFIKKFTLDYFEN